jgi:hypothetical protein
MPKHSEARWYSTPNFHKEFGYSVPPRRLRNILTTMVCVAISMAVITMTIGSLTQKGASALPIATVSQTPPSAIDTALAPPRASSIDTAAMSRPPAKLSCNDFEFSFLHSECSKKPRAKQAARRTHRATTLLIDHADASQSSKTDASKSKQTEGTRIAQANHSFPKGALNSIW